MKNSTATLLRNLIDRYCFGSDLSTYDPYDIWKTPAGLRVKHFYHCHPRLGLPPAAALAAFDVFLNQRARLFYRPLEYPIVRAFAALIALNWRKIDISARHLDWLAAHSSPGCRGCGWGLGFPHPVSKTVFYQADAPFTTITPYVLEAFAAYSTAAGSSRFRPVIDRIEQFFDEDVVTMHEDADSMATSYGAFRDRTVTNAVSYAMYSYSIFGRRERAAKLYEFVRRHQRADGSWLYSPEAGSFIDCFHSCIVLKNIVKTNRIMHLEGAGEVVRRGWDYVKNAFFDRRRKLFRRFALTNKPGLVRFDLYDNAEALNLALLMEETALASELTESVAREFVRGGDIFSQIDVFGRRINRNTLRWAAMPFLYAASEMLQ